MALPWRIIRAPSSGQFGKSLGTTALSHTTARKIIKYSTNPPGVPPIRIIKRPTLADQPIQTGGEQAETQPFEIPWELRELAEKNVEQHVRLTVSSWMPWRKQWPHGRRSRQT